MTLTETEVFSLTQASKLSGIDRDSLKSWLDRQWIILAPDDADCSRTRVVGCGVRKRLTLGTTFACFVACQMIRRNRSYDEVKEALATLIGAADLVYLVKAGRPLWLVIDGAWDICPNTPGTPRLSRSAAMQGGFGHVYNLVDLWRQFHKRLEEFEDAE
jgi:hypothetical protein